MLTALVVVVVLTVLTALYVAAEFSAISVRRSRVRQMAEDGHFLAACNHHGKEEGSLNRGHGQGEHERAQGLT